MILGHVTTATPT